jgi:hypothetical protein
MSRVYVIQQPRPDKRGWEPDLSSASDFGAIHFIFDSADRPSTDVAWAERKARHKLQEFDPAADYILWPGIGDPLAVSIVMKVLFTSGSEITGVNINMLIWNRKLSSDGARLLRSGFYTPVTI